MADEDLKNKKERSEVRREQEDIVPNYDHLFGDEAIKTGKKSGIFRKLVKVNARGIVLSTLVYFIQALPTWILPLATADIIDATTRAVNTGMTEAIAWELGINIGVLILSMVLNVPTTVLRWRMVSRIMRRTSAGLKSAVVRKLQSLSITYYKDMQSGAIQAKFLKDIESVDALFNSVFFGLIPSVIGIVVSSAISIYRNGYVSLFFLFIIPLNVWLTFVFRKKIRTSNKDYRVKTEDMSAKFTTMMEMSPITKSHGLQEVEIASLNRSIKDVTLSAMGVDRVHAYFGSLSWVVRQLLGVGCLVFCSFLAINGVISVGEIVLYQSMFNTISAEVSSVVGMAPQIGKGADALSSIAEIMNAKEVEHAVGGYAPAQIEGDVEFRHVGYRYPNGEVDVISDFNLKVESGKCVAFVGSSGSGKSTIMNMITGLLTPVSGEILIDGKSIEEYDLSAYRHNISVVPQNSILFSGTIRENITYGLERYTEEQLLKAVETANMNEFLKDMPNGLDTKIGEHGDKLSGGQKQRITIARAMIRDPKILILDEATSALDNVSEYQVQKAINASVSGRTTFIVAHRLSTIRNADLIVVMEEGKCVESGTFEELMAKRGKFYELKSLSDINVEA